ncbi:MAG: L-2-hydroxyglutarate oxidase [Chloroflexi bacterium]|nr:L-2-hydroxyglutarate oxidase [Chloroflexota bacterium]
MAQYDLVVVGAGIVGLAAARALALRYPRLSIAVVDKETCIGQHQTGHSSGVIHSGIYYTPGSLKARLCVEGGQKLYKYCDEKGIRVERCGKVIVAATLEELPGLYRLQQRGEANGLQGIELIDPSRLREIEPQCTGVQALWIPATGIVDYSAVARAFAEDILKRGGVLLLGRRVRGIRREHAGVILQTDGDDISTRFVITCGGLYADKLARFGGAESYPIVVPFRGDYWLLRPERRYLVRNLIYPVPDPSLPFLGVHFTRRITDGSVWLGPNAVLAFGREGYGRFTVQPDELGEVLGSRGFRRFAKRYWRIGIDEMIRDYSKHRFLESLRCYIPELTLQDLLPGPSGVRAQALDSSGVLIDDFIVHIQDQRVIHIRNAPSPAATSSLAIGRLICETASSTFTLS